MTMKHLLLFFLTVLFPFGGEAGAFEVDFSKDGVANLFDASAKSLQKDSDGLVVLPSRVETRPLPVEAGKKYRLEISAEVAGSFVVEANDRAHILTLQSFRQRLASTYDVVFQDANGKGIPALGGDKATLQGFFLTQLRKPYIAVFYAPENAASLKVRFESNGIPTRIASLQLAEETKEDTVNPNPDFRYGEWNYAGWRPQREGRLYTRPDGKTVLHTGYGGTSPVFPLQPENKYRISAVGEGDTINIEYFDKEGKSILRRFLLRPTPKGAETELTPPPGTAMARFYIYGTILEELKVVEVK